VNALIASNANSTPRGGRMLLPSAPTSSAMPARVASGTNFPSTRRKPAVRTPCTCSLMPSSASNMPNASALR